MQFSLTPSYSELFVLQCPEPQSLISDFDSEGILLYLSFINAQLYLNNENDDSFQSKLLNKLLSFWPESQKKEFTDIIFQFSLRQKAEPNLFKTVYITYFINKELSNIKSKNTKILNTFGEYQVLKAYFSYIEEFNFEFKFLNVSEVGLAKDTLKFQKTTWPSLIKQFDFNDKTDPIFNSITAGVLLEYFFKEQKYNEYVVRYLKHYKRNSVWQFVFDLLELVKISFAKSEENDYNNFFFEGSNEFSEILENLTINTEEYVVKPYLSQDFLGIRQKPLLKTNEGIFVVLYWKFLFNSIYTGTMFDFRNKSKIPLDFPNYKSIIGHEVFEKILFKKIFQHAMEKQHCILQFDDGKIDGLPDCYLRIGKYLFLIEFKDYFMATDIIASGSFEKIQEDINLKFIKNREGSDKGISQIHNQILKLNENHFHYDNFEKSGVKKRNLVIIPVIITTSIYHQMPGINNYLSTIFIENISDNDRLKFGQILPVTIIDFRFIYRNIDKFRKKEIDLKDLIISYQSKIKKNKNNYKTKETVKNAFLANASFEELMPKEVTKTAPQKDRDFIQSLFDALKINPETTTF
jgi:hypothetical protein